MENSFRGSMNWLHTWAGVTVGALLFAIFWMGTLAVFDAEIDRWMIPPTRLEAKAEPLSLDALWQTLRPPSGASVWSITLPTERNPTAQVRFRDSQGKWTHRIIDPVSGRHLPEPSSLAGTGFIYPFHVHLHIRSFEIGYWIVGFSGMTMLVMIVSGVIIHRKIFADFFSFRLRRKQLRSILDLHNVSGVLALPFHFMITLSGLIIFLSIYYPGIRLVSYSGDDRAYYSEAFGTNSYVRPKENRPAEMAPLDAMMAKAREIWGGEPVNSIYIYHPGDAGAFIQLGHSIEFTTSYNRDRVYFDAASGAVLSTYNAVPASRVQRFIAGLHFIQFRHWTLRWLYFFLGLTGCVMIATGYLFWLASRQKSHAQLGLPGIRMVEGLTVGSVTGIVTATLAFFVVNRLLPLGASAFGYERAALEVWTFYLVWLAAFVHAWLRPKPAWIEQCWAVTAFAVAAVLLNWITTGDHLVRSLAHRHLWPIAGIDLVLIAGAVVAALTARQLRHHAAAPPGRRIPPPVAGTQVAE